MPFVSITRLRVRRWSSLPRFLIQSIRAAHQARRAAGNLAVSVLRDADRAFWTRTVWRDEAAMRSFMRSGVYRRIMARLPKWCDEAAVVHWVQDAEEPPSWAEAHRRLQQEGRGSRVGRPSEAHRLETGVPEGSFCWDRLVDWRAASSGARGCMAAASRGGLELASQIAPGPHQLPRGGTDPVQIVFRV
jgi:quinol monooxygenase YgiN